MGMSWMKAVCMYLWRRWIEVDPFQQFYLLFSRFKSAFLQIFRSGLASEHLSHFPYRVATSLVCSHMDDMVGTLVVPFSTLNNFLGIASWRFGCCFMELPLYWNFFLPSMLAELSLLIILHLCDIAQLQNPLFFSHLCFIAILLLYYFFYFMRIMNKYYK